MAVSRVKGGNGGRVMICSPPVDDLSSYRALTTDANPSTVRPWPDCVFVKRRNANEEFHTEKRAAWRWRRNVREPRHWGCVRAIDPVVDPAIDRDRAARTGHRCAGPACRHWRA